MNVFFSLFLKGGSVLISFLLVPLTINYINPVQYGIWLTISSIMYWINIFDVGIGNGLKNEIAHSIAVKDESRLKKYVSTSYAILSIIGLFIFVSTYLLSFIFDWNKVLNISVETNLDIRPVITLFIAFFCVQFVLQLLNAVISATQQVFMSSLILLIGQIVGLLTIYMLTLLMPGNLFILVFALSGSSVVILILASIYLYNTKYRNLAPSFHEIDFKYVKRLLSFGGSFFIIQIGAMIIIYSNNFIVTRIFGPESVTLYNIPFRLFSFISMLFLIIIGPYWAAFTDAYATNDFKWIKKNVDKLRYIWFGLSLLGVLIFIFSDFLYKVWIGDAVVIPQALSFSMLLNVIVYMWHTIHVYFLNGVGKIRLQLFVVTISAMVNVPLAVYLGKSFGLQGVVYANTIVFLLMAVVYTLQYTKLVNQKAFKIWDK